MKYLFLLLSLLIFFDARALTLSRALEFEKALRSGACSLRLYRELASTELKEPFLILYIDDCVAEGKFRALSQVRGVKNLYARVELALALRKAGMEQRAKRIFSEVFSSPGAPSEDILELNLGDSSFLFKPEIIRKKVWLLASRGNTDEALFYLSYMREDPYYTYLLAYTYMKAGKRELAQRLFRLSTVPKSTYYLLFLSKDPVEKLELFKELLDLPLPLSLKRRASIYLLDYLFRNDLGLFRKGLASISNRKALRKTYLYFRDRFALFTGGCQVKLSDYRPQKWWKVACGKEGELPTGINFYSLLLNPPARFPFNREKIFKNLKLEDPGLRYLYRRGYCKLLTLVEKRTPQTALLMNLCGDYRKGIRFALPFRKEIENHPYLLAVLYPRPPVFKNDLISLSIARQESLFEPRALSRSGARGLMQIMPSTGRYIARKLKENSYRRDRLFDPELNYRFGSYYIHSLLKKFRLFPLAAAAYNGGPSRVMRALKLYGRIRSPGDLVIFTDVYLPFEETRDYVKRTAVNLYYYSNLYGTGKEWRTFLKP